MDNPLKILSAIRHARRPSRLSDMPTLRNSFWLRKGYAGLTFFGTIIAPSDDDVRAFERKGSTMKNHEMIHLRQAQSTHDSWLLFYLLYGWYYLTALPQNLKMRNAAYRLNPFELEAYAHQDELDYLSRHEATEWRQWARFSPRQRREKLFGKTGRSQAKG